MKVLTRLCQKISKKISRETLMVALIALVVSIISSFVAYKITVRQVPKFAVVDLAYLNNEFVMNLSRHLVEHHASDAEVEKAVKLYLSSLEAMLADINHSGNYILLQRQMVVSEGLVDLTQDLEKALFESVINSIK